MLLLGLAALSPESILQPLAQVDSSSNVPILHEAFPKMGDLQLMGAEKGSVLLQTNQPDVNGRITYAILQKQVMIDWKYKVLGLTDGKLLSDPTLARCNQVLTLQEGTELGQSPPLSGTWWRLPELGAPF